MPFAPVFGDIFQMQVSRERESRGFGAPSREAGIAISAVSDDRQVVRNRLRPHAELLDDSSFIADDLTSAIALNDSRPDDALRQILVRSADHHLADALVLRGIKGCGGQSIIGLKFDHW